MYDRGSVMHSEFLEKWQKEYYKFRFGYFLSLIKNQNGNNKVDFFLMWKCILLVKPFEIVFVFFNY